MSGLRADAGHAAKALAACWRPFVAVGACGTFGQALISCEKTDYALPEASAGRNRG
jgi:hypothetical protein